MAERYSQPALLNVKPTAQHRYPRGYTPERMQGVREATEGVIHGPAYAPPAVKSKVPCPTCGGKGVGATLDMSKVGPSKIDWSDRVHQPDFIEHVKNRGGTISGTMVHYPNDKCPQCGGTGKQRAETGRAMSESLDHPFYSHHTERQVQEAIARSTVPTSHLEGLHDIELLRERKFGMQGMGSTLGLYTKGKVRMFPRPAATPKRGPRTGQRLMEDMSTPSTGRRPSVENMVPVQGPRQRQEAEATLIHEIGHHVSQSPAGGDEEARADRYMTEHFRPDPRDVRRNRDISPHQFTYLARLGPMAPYGRHDLASAPLVEPRPKGRRKR